MTSTYRAYILLFSITFALSFSAWAHVGSAGVILKKQAGKYQVLVSIQPPDVVPGTAKITVFVEQGRVSSIGARPIFFRSGNKGAPTHDELTRTESGSYEGDVWLMDAGSSSIELDLNGPDGKELIEVPVMSLATALRDMPQGTGIGLALMGLLLVVMMITIVGASNADGIASSATNPARLHRRRLIGMGISAVVLVLILTGWRTWWTSTAEYYRNQQLYKPMPIQASVAQHNGQQTLSIRLDTTGFSTGWRRPLSFVLPEHGKLMHVFLVRMPGLDGFAHLHPTRQDTTMYQSALPNLPGGKYLVYADIVLRSGFAETLTDTIDLPSPAPTALNRPSDPDDSYRVVQPFQVTPKATATPTLDAGMVACGKPGVSTKLEDGSTMLWMDQPGTVQEAGKPYLLKFAVADAQGKPATLEPYLGMAGHAAVVRSDGSVYIHLHPVGTYSMAAEGSFVNRVADTARVFRYPNAKQFRDSIDAYVAHLNQLPDAERTKLLIASTPGMTHTMKVNNMVEFPYAFPRAGHYRIWVQVKRNGKVQTGVFDTEVKDPVF